MIMIDDYDDDDDDDDVYMLVHYQQPHHQYVLCILYFVDMNALLFIMTLLDNSVVAALCDCML